MGQKRFLEKRNNNSNLERIKNSNSPISFMACFSFDESIWNPTPKGFFQKLYRLYFNQRYSTTTMMRLSQYFYVRSRSQNILKRVIYGDLSNYYLRKNQTKNGLYCSKNPKIKPGIVFHHANIIITEETRIEENVHIYGNVTFGIKNGKAPIIKRGAKIAGNSMILGGVTIGEEAIVAPMALVLSDIPAKNIAAGIPAKVIGTVTERNSQF